MVHFNYLLLILSRLLHSRKEMRKYPVVTPKAGAGVQQPGLADGWAEFSHCFQKHAPGEQLPPTTVLALGGLSSPNPLGLLMLQAQLL